jgi:O-antigen ligase
VGSESQLRLRTAPGAPAGAVGAGIGVLLVCGVVWKEVIGVPGVVTYAYEFSQIKWVVAAIGLALWSAALMLGVFTRQTPNNGSLLDLAVGLFAVFAGLSFLWSPDPKAATILLSYGAIALGYYIVARLTNVGDLRDLLRWLVLGGLASTLVVAVGTGFDPTVVGGFGNPNFGSEFIVLLIGLGIVFWEEGSRSVRMTNHALIIIALVYVVSLDANLQFLALLSGALGGIIVWKRVRPIYLAGVILLWGVVSFLAAVLFVQQGYTTHLPVSWVERAQIWSSSLAMFIDAPFLGRGIGSYLHEAGSYLYAYDELAPWLGRPAFDNLGRLTDSSENELLQSLVEFGVVGTILGLGLFATFAVAALSADGIRRRAFIPFCALLGGGRLVPVSERPIIDSECCHVCHGRRRGAVEKPGAANEVGPGGYACGRPPCGRGGCVARFKGVVSPVGRGSV